jgi:hypothetical protein
VLEINYSAVLDELIRSIHWSVELPVEWSDYFQQRGEVASFGADERHHQRLKVRTYGVLWFEQSLPFRPRSAEPVGIYTRDFSRQGAGLLAPMEVYPEERVRIVLPTFWMQLHVVRARRITSRCYELGSRLIRRHDPSPAAFELHCQFAE